MYSACGTILCKVRGAEDELNTLAAATLTGLAYKSTGLYGGFCILTVLLEVFSLGRIKKKICGCHFASFRLQCVINGMT